MNQLCHQLSDDQMDDNQQSDNKPIGAALTP